MCETPVQMGYTIAYEKAGSPQEFTAPSTQMQPPASDPTSDTQFLFLDDALLSVRNVCVMDT